MVHVIVRQYYMNSKKPQFRLTTNTMETNITDLLLW